MEYCRFYGIAQLSRQYAIKMTPFTSGWKEQKSKSTRTIKRVSPCNILLNLLRNKGFAAFSHFKCFWTCNYEFWTVEQAYLWTHTWAAERMLFIANRTHYLALLHFDRLHADVGTDQGLVRSSWRLSSFSICSSLPCHVNPSFPQKGADAVFALAVPDSLRKYLLETGIAPFSTP